MFYLQPEIFWQQLPSDISNLYCFNTVLHQRISHGRTSDTSAVLLPLPINATFFLGWRISPFSDASSHLFRDRNKFTHYYICHQDTICHSVLYMTKNKFCKICIKQHWIVQHNLQIDVELYMLQMSYQLPYVPDKNIKNYAKCAK
jgi:hypothetical protein